MGEGKRILRTVHLLVISGLILALMPLLAHTSETPIILGRYSPQTAILIFVLSALVILVGIIPIAAPQRITHWLIHAVEKLAISSFALELFSILVFVFEITLISVAIYAWGASTRSLCVVGGSLLIIAGIVVIITHTISQQRMRHLTGNLTLSILGLGLGLVFTELGLNLIAPEPASYTIHRVNLRLENHPDPTIFPGVSGVSVFTTDHSSLRGDPYVESNYNILAIGGSTTEELYLDDFETWAHLVQVSLGTTASKQQVWVGNAGVSGHTSANHSYVLRYLASQYRLDTIIMLLGANDLSAYLLNSDKSIPDPDNQANHTYLMDNTFRTVPKTDSFQFEDLQLVELSKYLFGYLLPDHNPRVAVQDTSGRWIAQWREWLHQEQTMIPMPDLEDGLDQYGRNLKIIIRDARAQNVRLVFVTQPVIWSENLPPEIDARLWMFYAGKGAGRFDPADLRTAMDAFNARLLEVCEAERIECIDIATSMSGNPDYFFDDMHFTEQGAAEVASLIADYFRDHSPFTP